MNKLHPFYFAQTKEGEQTDAIIFNSSTLSVGRLRFYKSYALMTTEVHNTTALAWAIVPEMNIAVYYLTNLATGDRLRMDPDTLKKLEQEMKAMAAFFYRFKVLNNHKQYLKRYGTERNP